MAAQALRVRMVAHRIRQRLDRHRVVPSVSSASAYRSFTLNRSSSSRAACNWWRASTASPSRSAALPSAAMASALDAWFARDGLLQIDRDGVDPVLGRIGAVTEAEIPDSLLGLLP
jgi:hypothetical protein